MTSLRMSLFFLLVAATALAQPGERLSNIRQLTSGGQNAEAYWSPDGQRLVFQSTREGHGCDQIYIMNADGSGQRMISTGKGVTTCGYFLPDGKQVVYASTHEASPECPPRPDRSQGYVWAVYPNFELYVADDSGGNLRKLTDSPRYDAEATVNWKTKRIVYTSMASGDLDLWSMDAGGADRRRLTESPGYDGGAFFSPDGQKIVWRANHPGDPAGVSRYEELLSQDLTAPMKMEIFVANADGSEARQITDFGCASFAPQFTPDGKSIIFSSNKNECDSRKFELFMMDLDGGNIEQVTNFGGFTSFGEFSPDGKKLVFTSDWKAQGRYEFNIFVADWKP
jgi:Tol biopolymer transport system component